MSKHNFSLEERIEIIERFLSSIGPFEGFKAEPEIFPAKRTIKGGWVNVYRISGVDESIGFSRVHPLRPDADTNHNQNANHLSRIACIHIPDFEEGEGL